MKLTIIYVCVCVCVCVCAHVRKKARLFTKEALN